MLKELFFMNIYMFILLVYCVGNMIKGKSSFGLDDVFFICVLFYFGIFGIYLKLLV